MAPEGNRRPPTKVLFYYQDYGATGGIEKYIEQISNAFQTDPAMEPVVVCTANGSLFKRLAASGVRVYGIKSASRFSKSILRTFDVWSLLQLGTILQNEEPDLIHVHIGLVENLFFKWLGYPVVYGFHGYSTLYSMQSGSCIKRAFKHGIRKLFNLTTPRMDALVFVSEAERKRTVAEGFLPDGVGEVLPNGINPEDLRKQASAVSPADLKRSLDIPGEAKCVSFIGRLDANKNPLQFVDFAEWLSADLPDVHFILSGDGPLKAALEARCRRSPISQRLHLLGYRDDIPALMKMSDLLVQLSALEGFGLGMLEAMAIGTPSIGYRVGGLPEVMGEAVSEKCLVSYGDLNRLVDRALMFLTAKAPERAALAEQLRARANVFGLASYAENLKNIYRRVLTAKEFQPKVSVILPVYNGANVVTRAAESVLSQTYRNLELIVVNDGSTDETRDVLNALTDSRVKILHEKNTGVSAARNHAFQQATGDYIAFIDADDVWFPQKLAREIEVLQGKANRKALVYSSYYAVDEADRLINLPTIWRAGGDLSEAVLRHEGIFLPSTTLVHREIVEAIGGFKVDCYHEDRAFFIQACQQYPAYPTGQRLVAYRQSLSGRCRAILQEYDQALNAEMSIVTTLAPALSIAQTELLSRIQTANLFNRFLMYGYLDHARKLFPKVDASLLRNKKGALAYLSIKTGFNLLSGSRALVQIWMRYALLPWWLWQSCFMLRFDQPDGNLRAKRDIPVKASVTAFPEGAPAC